jgi:Flp pilus assembly CpaF family ATPase
MYFLAIFSPSISPKSYHILATISPVIAPLRRQTARSSPSPIWGLQSLDLLYLLPERRTEYFEGLPAVAIRDLLKASLRHRPDRIILGEIRGGEAFDLLQLLNTGHSGTLSTVHASSAQQAISRFTSCVLQSGVELPYRAIKTNIGDSLNVIVQLERRPGRRFVSEVIQINKYNPNTDEFEFVAEPTFA